MVTQFIVALTKIERLLYIQLVYIFSVQERLNWQCKHVMQYCKLGLHWTFFSLHTKATRVLFENAVVLQHYNLVQT